MSRGPSARRIRPKRARTKTIGLGRRICSTNALSNWLVIALSILPTCIPSQVVRSFYVLRCIMTLHASHDPPSFRARTRPALGHPRTSSDTLHNAALSIRKQHIGVLRWSWEREDTFIASVFYPSQMHRLCPFGSLV